MSLRKKAAVALDLALETFFTACSSILLGRAAWENYPSSPHARELLNEWRGN